ncbi:WhiB family transcriptional regulator [Embleya hyalina]|uniref:WhiB family transcriptional regulator n=1 Tax=Embleya hyalina TaxID=516124 RepID=UPI000F8163A3|nr:WhiB family transcriptional regulator [Embleya hyalina]
MDWRSAAACTHEDPELFFPVGNSGPAAEQIDRAKSVCRRCPVIDRCLSWAMATRQESGVWGGLDEDERRARRGGNTRRRHGRHAA